MSDPNRSPDNGKNDQNDETKLGGRTTLFVWLGIAATIAVLLTFRKPGQTAPEVLSYPDFIAKVENKLIRNGSSPTTRRPPTCVRSPAPT